MGIVSLPVIDPTLDLLKAKGHIVHPERAVRPVAHHRDMVPCVVGPVPRAGTEPGGADAALVQGEADLTRAPAASSQTAFVAGDAPACDARSTSRTSSRSARGTPPPHRTATNRTQKAAWTAWDDTMFFDILIHTINLPLMASSYHKRRTCASGEREILLSAYSLTRRSPRTSKAASPLRHEKTLKSPADASRGIVQTAEKGFQPFSRERLPALWRPHERPWASRAHAAASTRPTPRISQERRTVEPGTNDARSEKPAARVAAVARKAVGRRPQGERRRASAARRGSR